MEKYFLRKRVLVFWEGIPSCGGLLRTLANYADIELRVVATRAVVPFYGLEQLIGITIEYIEIDDYDWILRHSAWPDLFIFTGWNHKAVVDYARWLKIHSNSRTCLVSDNNFRFTMRQLVGSVYFRLVLLQSIDFCFVPGSSAFKLMRLFGFSSSQIFVGNYGAASFIFKSQTPINERPQTILFAGQLNDRKRVRDLVDGYVQYRRAGGRLLLNIAGTGELDGYRSSSADLTYLGFVQPTDLASLMSESQVFVLLSKVEHWGTVVCEAARSGCIIIASEAVGSAADLVRNNVNGYIIDRVDKDSIQRTLEFFEALPDDVKEIMSQKSTLAGSFFDENSYFVSVMNMLSRISSRKHGDV